MSQMYVRTTVTYTQCPPLLRLMKHCHYCGQSLPPPRRTSSLLSETKHSTLSLGRRRLKLGGELSFLALYCPAAKYWVLITRRQPSASTRGRSSSSTT